MVAPGAWHNNYKAESNLQVAEGFPSPQGDGVRSSAEVITELRGKLDSGDIVQFQARTGECPSEVAQELTHNVQYEAV